MPTGLTFGDGYGNTTILDYDTDPDNDRDDDISDSKHSDDGTELEDKHSLSSFRSVGEGELEDVENQGDHFNHSDDNSSGSEYDNDSDENTTDEFGSNKNPGVEYQEESRRSSRNRQEPERFAESEHSPTFAQVSLSFFQAVTQNQNNIVHETT